MRHFVGFILILICLGLMSNGAAHAQHSFDGYSLDQLKSELNEAQIYQALGQAKAAADGTRGCYQYNNEMLSIRQSLINLTQRYEGRADSVYHQKRGELQEQFRLAQRGYEDCYNLTLADYPALSYAGVRTLADFKSKVGMLNPKFSNKGDIVVYISAIENAIENLSQQRGKRVGVIESVFKTVEISRGGQGQWEPLVKGSYVHILDELRTGPLGRIRITFNDRLSSSNAGPSVVNIGSSSHVKIEKFLISFTNPPKRESAISLLRGTVRAFTKNWGPHSNFTLRAGATICGIRGTEVAVSYDPITYTATHVLDHGEAYLEAGNRQVQLTPRTSVTVVGDQMDWPVAVSDTAWSKILEDTTSNDAGHTSEIIDISPQIQEAQPQSRKITNHVPNMQSSKLTIIEALETFRAYQLAVIANDSKTAISLMAEPERSDAMALIMKEGFSKYVSQNKPFYTWEIDCAACFDDEREGRTCIINDYKHLGSPNDKKGWLPGMYMFKKHEDITYITGHGPYNPKRRKYMKKMYKKKDKICKFDQLTIGTSNLTQEVNNRDGIRTLLKGIGEVLDQIE